MRKLTCKLIAFAMLSAMAGLTPVTGAVAQQAQIDRGKYLVTIGGCNDCHTPGYFFGKPDMTRFLDHHRVADRQTA
jgi:mono/diheme cytochrome c family protein